MNNPSSSARMQLQSRKSPQQSCMQLRVTQKSMVTIVREWKTNVCLLLFRDAKKFNYITELVQYWFALQFLIEEKQSQISKRRPKGAQACSRKVNDCTMAIVISTRQYSYFHSKNNNYLNERQQYPFYGMSPIRTHFKAVAMNLLYIFI